MKKSSILFELILIISVIAIIYLSFTPKKDSNNLKELENRIILYLKELRYQALIDDKFKEREKINDDSIWHKRRWTMKFFRCRESVGGVYFVIYSEKNDTGQINQKESLKDPLTKKYIFANNYCEQKSENSSYNLLSKNYNIKSVDMTCNSTTSLGQISFGNDGRVYSKLSNIYADENNYEIKKPCKIKFITNDNKFFEIEISPKTGFSQIISK
jgi:hypothetical protein